MSFKIRPFVLAVAVCAASLTMWPAVASAQRHGEFHGGGGRVIVGGGFYSPYFSPFYDPFWGPWGWYGYGPMYYDNNSEVKIKAMPKDAQVYVDGYFAGPVDKFDGVFQHLSVAPGGHEIELYKDGFQTIHQRVYLQPGSSFTMHDTMEPLAPGQKMEGPPTPASAAAYQSGGANGRPAD